MKKRVALATALSTAVFALTSSAVLAADAAPANDQGGCCACPADPVVTGDVYAGPLNKYLFRGNDFSGGKWVVQGGMDLYYGNWTLGYWTNYQGKATKDQSYVRGVNETDIFLEYAYTPTDLVTFTLGNSVYAMSELTTNELYLKTTLKTLLSPTVAIYWDWHKASKQGLFYTASISHEFEIERNLLALSVGALASYNQHNNNASAGLNDDFDGGYSGFHNYELNVSVDYKPTSWLTITPSYLFSDALSDKAKDIAGIKDQHLYGVKATLAF
jgi:hypothetical protein